MMKLGVDLIHYELLRY